MPKTKDKNPNYGGYREGSGRKKKAPARSIRIIDEIADILQEVKDKQREDWLVYFLQQNIGSILGDADCLLEQQDINNKLPPILSKALLNDSLVELLERIFIKFSPDDFISYWSDIDLTEIEIEPVPEVTPERIDTANIPEVKLTKDATPEKSEFVSKVEFSDYKSSDGHFLTKEQFNILEAVRHRLSQPQKKGLLIEALAGTGKSTMLAEIAKVLKDEKLSPLECRFVVFGRKNKQDLVNKLSKIKWEKSVQTLNSLGYEILRDALGKNHKQFRLNNGKYEKIAQDKGYCATRWPLN